MKILIIMEGFFPGQQYGGPPVSIDNFCTLMDKYDSYIITKNHDMNDLTPYSTISEGWNDRENCKVLYLSEKEYGLKAFEKYIKELNPDILYLQGLFQKCIVPCLFLAKKYDIPTMLAPRGELCLGAFKKKYKKIPYIIFLKVFGLLKNCYFQSTSDEESNAIKYYLSKQDNRIFLLSNVPSIPLKKDLEVNKKSGEARLIFLSRIVPKKNLLSAIDFMFYVEGKVTFDIYGIIEDENYWEECKKKIACLPKNIKVQYRGAVNHDKVHDTFRKYDAFIFPTYSENYGHVIIESLMVGTPVILSDQTPWNDVQEARAGYVCALNQSEEFKEGIQKIVDMSKNEYLQFRDNAKNYIRKKMDIENIKKYYIKCFNGLKGGN